MILHCFAADCSDAYFSFSGYYFLDDQLNICNLLGFDWAFSTSEILSHDVFCRSGVFIMDLEFSDSLAFYNFINEVDQDA